MPPPCSMAALAPTGRLAGVTSASRAGPAVPRRCCRSAAAARLPCPPSASADPAGPATRRAGGHAHYGLVAVAEAAAARPARIASGAPGAAPAEEAASGPGRRLAATAGAGLLVALVAAALGPAAADAAGLLPSALDAAASASPADAALLFTFSEAFPDPASARALIAVLRPVFTVATIMFIVRIIMTWDPEIKATELPWSIAYVPTEPLLGPTRKAIPAVGGVDVSPIVWLAVISLANEIFLGPQGILVLISNQVSLL